MATHVLLVLCLEPEHLPASESATGSIHSMGLRCQLLKMMLHREPEHLPAAVCRAR